MKNFEEVDEVVKQRLSEKRYRHSRNVMDRCVEYARTFGEDVEKARLIGIAHDIAKEIPKEKRIEKALEDETILDDFEKEHKSLIHAKHGAMICKKEFGFTDDMCDAISYHTTAKPNMSNLAKILYLSDYSEAGRDFPDAIIAYELGKKDLDKAYLYSLVGKIKYILEERGAIHQDSIDAYNDMIKK